METTNERLDTAQIGGVRTAEIRRHSRIRREMLAVGLVDIEPAAEETLLFARAVRQIDKIRRVRLSDHVAGRRHALVSKERDRNEIRSFDAQQPNDVSARRRLAAIDCG